MKEERKEGNKERSIINRQIDPLIIIYTNLMN